jgi:putative endonuclease
VSDQGRERGGGWSVYVVRCRDGSLYCGATNDVTSRIAAHNEGCGAKYTRGRRPVRLVFSREAGSRSEALREEARIKGLTRQEKLKLTTRHGAIEKSKS